MEMIFAPGFPSKQARELEMYCRTNKISCSHQMAASPELLMGSIILGIGFISKSFLDEFLKELAKDAYKWLKTGSAVEECSRTQPINTSYHIHVGNVFIHDEEAAFTNLRHKNVLEVIPQVFDRLQPSDRERVERIELILRDSSSEYVKARCYDSKIESFDWDEATGKTISIDKPLALIDILNRTDTETR